jgi:hypothetical protein
MLHRLIMIKIEKRDPEAVDVQNILTEFGCCIKTRLGLHEVEKDNCSTTGLIILQLGENSCDVNKFLDKLNALPHVIAKFMEI